MKLKMLGLIVLGSLFGLSGCKWQVKRDFDRYCKLAEEINKDPALDSGAKQVTLARRSSEMSFRSKQFDTIQEAIAFADPALRYMLLQRGAEEVGYPGWECSAVQTMLTPTSAQSLPQQ